LQRGVPPDRIKRDLAQLEGYAALEVTTDPNQALAEARLPGGGPPVTPEEQAEGKEFFTRTLPRAAAVTAGGLAAGPGLIAGAAGAAGGDILYQAGRKLITGEPIEPAESARVGGEALLGGGIMKGIVRSAGAVGGVAREFIDYAGRTLRPFKKGEGFRLTFGRPAQEAELELGRKIQGAVEAMSKQVSEGRIAKEALIKRATAGGARVDVKPVVDKLREFVIPNATEASAVNFNKRLVTFADRLERRVRMSGPSRTQFQPTGAPRGTLSPEEFDVLMTRELSPAAFTGTGKPSLNRFSSAIRAARNTAKETLETAIPEVRAANQAAFAELTIREQADAVFGPGKLSLESRLRNLFKPGHEAEQQLLDKIGKQADIPLLEDAKKLATKRAFTRDDRVTAGVLNRVFLLTGTPQIARGIAKVGAPLQPFIGPLTGGAGAALEEELRIGRREPQ
jgi:hypothetical protein